ncbi:MAG: ATP-binding protein [Chloroflexales bacterium]
MTEDLLFTGDGASRQSVLYDVLRQLTRELDPDVIIQKAVSAIVQLNRWHSVGISLPSADGLFWQTRAEDRMPPGEVGVNHPIHSGVIGRAYRTGEIQLVPDVRADPDFFLGENVENVGSEMAIPIIFDHQTLGVMNLESDQRENFDHKDVAFAQSITAIIAIALTNAQRFTALQQEMLVRTQSEARFTTIFQHSPLSIVITHQRDNVMREVNLAWLELLGYTREEVIGHTALELGIWANPHDRQRVVEMLHNYGRVSNVETIICQKSGQKLHVLLSAEQIVIDNDTCMLFQVTDITARKRAEHELESLTQTLEVQVEQRTAELEYALKTKGEFMANMSHELRTPLNAILALSEILREEVHGSLNTSQQEALQHIEDSSYHLLALINDVLNFSKADAGQMNLQIENISVAEVCQESLQFVKEIAIKKHLRLSFRINDMDATMQADSKRLKQILVNLLSNAVKFTPSGGKISLEVVVESEANIVRFAVRDTGIGILPEDKARLFQPFTQIDSRLNRQHEGTGLGLAIVHRLVDLHGGNVTFESDVGQGSCFMITLPYHSVAPVPAPDTSVISDDQRAQTAVVPPQPAPTGAQILLAEDNVINQNVIHTYLHTAGYRVVNARTGREAINQAMMIHPDLILMDIQMPDMDGLEATRHLRAIPEFKETPIIAMTALSMSDDRDRCLDAGASAYLSKPVSLKDLVEIIQRFVKK